MKKVLSLILVLLMVLSISTAALAKTYKSNKVTAKQIVTELKKITGYIKSTSKQDDIEDLLRTPNYYKSKYNFVDKKYKDVYCTVEVFRDNYDAARRQGYIDTMNYFYSVFEAEEDIPLVAYRYKNVVIRFNTKFKLERALKYYNALKKIIK